MYGTGVSVSRVYRRLLFFLGCFEKPLPLMRAFTLPAHIFFLLYEDMCHLLLVESPYFDIFGRYFSAPNITKILKGACKGTH